jgi:hypothetical protein
VDCTVNNTHGTSSTIARGTNTDRASGTCAPSILFRGTASKSFFTRVRFSRFRRCARCEEDEDEHEVEAPLNDVVVECQKHLFPGSAGGDGPSQRARAKEEETEVEVAAEEEEEEEKAKEKKPRRRKDEATLRIVFIA